MKIPLTKGGKKAKPSGGCPDGFQKPTDNPQALRERRLATMLASAPPPLLRGNIFIERGSAARHEKLLCVYWFAGSTGRSTLDELPPLNRPPVPTTSPSNLPASPIPERIVLIGEVSKVALRSEVSFCTCS